MKYEDFKIFGINLSGPTEQRTNCPECEIRLPYKKSSSRNSKDLGVNIQKEIWSCFRCGWVGTLKVKTYEKEFVPIVKKSKELINKEGLLDYFKSRGIPAQVVNRNRITAEEAYFPQYNKNIKSIAFNYYVGEDIINVKWRSANKDFMQVGGAPQILYKLNDIQNSNKAIVCEGEIDALSFEAVGLQYSISVPAGGIQPNAKSIDKKLEFIENSWEYISHIESWYLAFDTDAPGIRLMEEFSRRVGRFKCFIIKFPNDCKDANEVLTKLGKEVLKECFEKAEPYPVEGVFEANSSYDKLDEIFENGFPDGFKTGIWPSLDEKIMWYTSTIYGFSGIPSHGKSNFTDHLMIGLSITNGIKWGVFSSENSKMEIHIRKLIEIVIGAGMLPNSKFKMSRNDYEAGREFVNEHFFFILPPNNDLKLNKILEAGEYLVRSKGIKGLIIDPWNTIDHETGKMSETDYIQKTLNQLTYYERNLDLMLFIVYHPAKMAKQTNGKKYQIPSLYDGSGSAHWGNKMEGVITIYRDYADDLSYTKETLALVQKVKHDFMGSTGFVKFDFDANCRRFLDRNIIQYGGNQNYLTRRENAKVELQKQEDYPKEWDEYDF